MNRFNLLLGICLITACANPENRKEEEMLKDKLPATLVNNPRSMISEDTTQLQELGKLIFKDTLHDFGILHEGEVVEFDFFFTNGGRRDIIINEAKGSCGCTVPEFPGRPVKSGEQEKIKVTFNSEGKKGINEKSVMVTTNGNPAVYNIIIRAKVLDK